MSARGMSGHHSPRSETDVWLTPPHIIEALGPFDLDPCAAPEPRPWPTAAEHWTHADTPLMRAWHGRVWMNPPYGGPDVVGPWMQRMVTHGRGTALIFARTETEVFQSTVWRAATALLFLAGRLFFHRADGTRAAHNAGAPSVLVAYGLADALRLADCALPGAFVMLRHDRRAA
jgi:hypothetical protein